MQLGFRGLGNFVKLTVRKSIYGLTGIIALYVVIFFQNCGQFRLERNTSFSSLSSSVDLTMRPPTEFAWHRRYIFLVDMSYSMVSGPCPFDVDVQEKTTGFNNNAYHDYDPNFPDSVNFSDARARVADCSVDQALNFGEMILDYSQPTNSAYLPNHKTFKGHDYDGNRFKILKEWIRQMRQSNNQEFLERTQILIVPAGGGIAFERLLSDYPQRNFAFVGINDPILDISISYMEDIHLKAAQQAALPPAQRFEIYDPHMDKLRMGTTALNFSYDTIFKLVDKEMEKLATANNLTHTNFKMISFGDTRTNPFESHFNKALSYISDCADCPASLEKAWGKKQDDQLETLDLKLSLIQGLTKYYGSGFFDLDFFNMRNLAVPDVIKYFAKNGSQIYEGGEYPDPQVDILKFLDNRSADRKASTRIFKISQAKPPYRIANVSTGETIFKTTHVLILNSNFKVDNNGVGGADADGDGLVDDKEALFQFDPQKARTNGICLDILMVESGFKDRCETLANSKLCSAQLDSDGDSLNECEEMTIGTDPFDFDTEGDGVPDSIEVLYGLNPLYDDNMADSNGDSLTNVMSLGMGLNPSVMPNQVPDTDIIKITLNYLHQESSHSPLVGDVKTDIYKIDLQKFPLRRTYITAEPNMPFYLLRPGSKGFNASAQISSLHDLIKPTGDKNTNKLIGIIRIVDPEEPLRVYWETFELPLDTRKANVATSIDLSLFTQMKVIDRVRLDK